MRNLTINILTFNNEDTIERLIQSIKIKNTDIIVGDIGSKDKTINICKSLGVICKNLSFGRLDDARNYLVEESNTDWQMYLEPNECIKSGCDEIEKAITGNKVYGCYILQNKVISKSARIWNKKDKLKFKNPVFEYLDVDKYKIINCIITSNPVNVDSDKVNKWIIDAPTSASPYYYQSFLHLSSKKYSDFILSSDKYLFYEKQKCVSWLITHYYRAIVFLNFLNDLNNAVNEIKLCLAAKIDMAEFWCLLGDMFYFKIHDFSQASKMYENALEYGKNRDIEDEYPIEPLKYKEYPIQKIQDCGNALSETKTYSIKKELFR